MRVGVLVETEQWGGSGVGAEGRGRNGGTAEGTGGEWRAREEAQAREEGGMARHTKSGSNADREEG
eukprot:2823404-Rhodomonas_salina.2